MRPKRTFLFDGTSPLTTKFVTIHAWFLGNIAWQNHKLCTTHPCLIYMFSKLGVRLNPFDIRRYLQEANGVQGRGPRGHKRRPNGTFCAGGVDGVPPPTLSPPLTRSPYISLLISFSPLSFSVCIMVFCQVLYLSAYGESLREKITNRGSLKIHITSSA